MYSGQLIFSQVMLLLPLHRFRQCVLRYKGNYKTQKFTCLDQYLCMAFAQLTYRESLRDIETCLNAQNSKLYHMGIRADVSRSILAYANETKDWRIYADFAQVLIAIARPLYVNQDLGLEIKEALYALDSSTIDLCLASFPWAKFRKTKGAIKLHTLLDLRGSIPTFIHISDGKLHDVNVLDLLLIEAGAFYIMDRGYLDFLRLFQITQALAFFVTRAKRNFAFERIYSHPADKEAGILCDQTIKLSNSLVSKDYPEKLRRIKFYDKEQGKKLVFLTNQLFSTGFKHCQTVQISLAGGTFFQMDQTAFKDQSFLRNLGECGQNSNLDRRFDLRFGCHFKKEIKFRTKSLHNFTSFKCQRFRENAHPATVCWQ